MSKHIWNIINHKESVRVKWVNTYKLKGRSFWDIPERADSSWAWKKLSYRGMFRDHIVHRIGDGLSTSLWFDNWHAICPLSNFISWRDIMYSGLSIDCKVADVIKNGMWEWPANIASKFDGLTVIFPPCLLEGKLDKVQWKNNKGRQKDFSVSEAWNDIRSSNGLIPWSRLVWFSQCIPRHSFMLWLAVLGKLRTHDKIQHWENVDTLSCVFCKKVQESHNHLFFECEFPKEVWCRFKDMERNLRTFQKYSRSMEVVCELIKDVVKLRVMSLSLNPSAQVFQAAELWFLRLNGSVYIRCKGLFVMSGWVRHVGVMIMGFSSVGPWTKSINLVMKLDCRVMLGLFDLLKQLLQLWSLK
ncbi:RNA-directed DNA polymerase, eukaryota, reverse transcriptase zinc-binding domain protein [Tanacetum coccineum]